jgi:3-oxoacid CoA-transferase subunit A
MVYITGDIHGQTERIIYFADRFGMTEEDIIVILGDVGANYYLNKRDKKTKEALSSIKPTILCIHGNHEARPDKIAGYETKIWNDGLVQYQPDYPNLLFAVDGALYNIDGKQCIALGGAYSVDKYYRLEKGYAWFEDEQPSDAIKNYVNNQLLSVSNKVDVVFSHTCPFKYEPKEAFLSCIDQSTVDDSTEKWLDAIEDKLDYKAWYCGHWHTDKRIDKMHFLFEGWEVLEDVK